MASADWERLCPARDVTGRRPLAIAHGDLPLAVFRDEHGQVSALLDRCPHRGVPLSMGKLCKGRVTCCYHGWEFDAAGRCLSIPSNLEPMAPKAMVSSFETKEEGGYVWVRSTPQES